MGVIFPVKLHQASYVSSGSKICLIDNGYCHRHKHHQTSFDPQFLNSNSIFIKKKNNNGFLTKNTIDVSFTKSNPYYQIS
jgi:hypothetical protein